jgi:hypothetical protein
MLPVLGFALWEKSKRAGADLFDIRPPARKFESINGFIDDSQGKLSTATDRSDPQRRCLGFAQPTVAHCQLDRRLYYLSFPLISR